MSSMLVAEQKIEIDNSKSQEQLELKQLKEHLLVNEIAFRAPPGLEDQLNAWPPVEGKFVLQLNGNHEDQKIAEDVEEDTTCAGSGSERDGDSEDESPSQLSADAPEFCLNQLSAAARVFDPTVPQLSADAPVFNPTPLRTSLKSSASLFVPGSAKTKLTAGAQLFKPRAAPKEAEPAVVKTKLTVTSKSELFVPEWPALNASVSMKTKEPKKR